MAGIDGFVGLSNDSWIAWAEEATYAQSIVPPSSPEFGLVLTENLIARRERRVPPTVTQAHRFKEQRYLARTEVLGSAQFPVVYEDFENLFLHGFGQLSNVGAGPSSGTFTRDFDLSPQGRFRNATSPSLTMYASRGIVGSGATNPSVFYYDGVVIDEFEFSCSGPSEPLLFTPTFVGQDAPTPTQPGTATSFPSSPVANGVEAAVTWGGVGFFCDAFTIRARKSLDRERRRFGTSLISEPTPAQWEVSGTFGTEWDGELRASSVAMFIDHINGTTRELKFAFTGPTIPSTASPYQFDLIVPSGSLDEWPVSTTQRGRQRLTVPFTGWATTTGAPPTTARELRLTSVNARNFTD